MHACITVLAESRSVVAGTGSTREVPLKAAIAQSQLFRQCFQVELGLMLPPPPPSLSLCQASGLTKGKCMRGLGCISNRQWMAGKGAG